MFGPGGGGPGDGGPGDGGPGDGGPGDGGPGDGGNELSGDIVIVDDGSHTISTTYTGQTLITSVTIPDTITTISALAFSGCSALASVILSPTSQLTTIGNSAFSGCTSLTSILIPASVITFGENIFNGCNALQITLNCPTATSTLFTGCTVSSVTFGPTAVTISDGIFSGQTTLTAVTFDASSSLTTIGMAAFNFCTSLATINIPSSVATIGSIAFQNCSMLSSCTFDPSSSLTSIGDSCFSDCSSLVSIEFPPTVQTYGITLLGNCTSLTSASFTFNSNNINPLTFTSMPVSTVITVIIGPSVTEIPSSAFINVSAITSVTCSNPSAVTSIGDGAFYGCTGLTTIDISFSSLTSIGNSAFSGCTGLTTIDISFSSLTSIGNSAFSGCTGLTSLIIPDLVTTLGTSILDGCTSLQTVVIGNSVPTLDQYLFQQCTNLESVTVGSSVTAITTYQFRNLTHLATVLFQPPSSVTSIGSYAFDGCTALATIQLPNSVTSIGTSAFSGCSSLSSINIPPSVTSLDGAFTNCSALTSVTFDQPSSLTTIANQAFSNCSILTAITFPDSVSALTSAAFTGCTSLTSINIPPLVSMMPSLQQLPSLTTVYFNVPSSITSIPSFSFTDCSSLKTVVLPSSVETLDPEAFYLTELTNLVVTNNALATYMQTNVSTYPFLQSLNFYQPVVQGSLLNGIRKLWNFGPTGISGSASPIVGWTFSGPLDLISVDDAVTSITQINGTFTEFGFPRNVNVGIGLSGQTTLTKVILPPACTTIDVGFPNAVALQSISIPLSVTSFCANAFSDSGLESIAIHPNVTTIGASAFAFCEALTTVTIDPSSSLQSIGDNAFQGCTAASSFAVPPSVTSIGSSAFEHSGIQSVVIPAGLSNILANTFYRCSSLTTVSFDPSSSLIGIGAFAFATCSALTSIAIPLSVTQISSSSFLQCSALNTVTIDPSSSLMSIGTMAFKECSAISAILIPATVTEISGDAFLSCTSLSSVTLDSPATITTLGHNAFRGTPFQSTTRATTAPSNPESTSTITRYNLSWQVPVNLPSNLFGGYNVYKNQTKIASGITATEYSADISADETVTFYVSCDNILNGDAEGPLTPFTDTNLPIPTWLPVYIQNPFPIMFQLTNNASAGNYFLGYGFDNVGIQIRKNTLYNNIFGLSSSRTYLEYVTLCISTIQELTQPTPMTDLTTRQTWQLYNVTLAYLYTDIYLTLTDGDPVKTQAQNGLISFLPTLIYVGSTAPLLTISSVGYLGTTVSWDLSYESIMQFQVSTNNGILGYNVYLNDTLVSENQQGTAYANYDLSDNTIYTVQISAKSILEIESPILAVTFQSNDTLPSWWPVNFTAYLNNLPNASIFTPPNGTADAVTWRLETAYPYYIRDPTAATLQDFNQDYLAILRYNSSHGNGNVFEYSYIADAVNSVPIYMVYVALCWIYVDMTASTDRATHNYGITQLIALVPQLLNPSPGAPAVQDASADYFHAYLTMTPPANATITLYGQKLFSITGYNVYMGSELVGQNVSPTTIDRLTGQPTTALARYDIYTLTPDVSYSFQVAALNSLGVESSKTVAVTVSTQPLPAWWNLVTPTSIHFLKNTLPPRNFLDFTIEYYLANNVLFDDTAGGINDLLWYYSEKYLSTTPADHNAGIVGLILYLPLFMDFTVPANPEDLISVAVGYFSATISWTPSSYVKSLYGVNIQQTPVYNIYRNSALISQNLPSSSETIYTVQPTSSTFSIYTLQPDASYSFVVTSLDRLGQESGPTAVTITTTALPIWWKPNNRPNILTTLLSFPVSQAYLDPSSNDQGSAEAAAWRQQNAYSQNFPSFTLQDCIDIYSAQTPPNNKMLNWIYFDLLISADASGEAVIWFMNTLPPMSLDLTNIQQTVAILRGLPSPERITSQQYSLYPAVVSVEAVAYRRQYIYGGWSYPYSDTLADRAAYYASQTPIDYEMLSWIYFDMLLSTDATATAWLTLNLPHFSIIQPNNRGQLLTYLKTQPYSNLYLDPSSNDQTSAETAEWRRQNIHGLCFTPALINLLWIQYDRMGSTDPQTYEEAVTNLITYLPMLINVYPDPPIIIKTFIIYLSTSIWWLPPENNTDPVTGNTVDITRYNIYFNNEMTSINKRKTKFSDYDLSANVMYVIQVAATNILGVEGQKYSTSITQRDDLPSWWSWDLPQILQGFPNVATYTPPNTVSANLASTWRLQNIYSLDLSDNPNPTFQDCAEYYEEKLLTSIDSRIYVEAAWLYTDMHNSTDVATHNQGVDWLILLLPFTRGVVRAIQFSDGGPDDQMTHIPTDYFASVGDAVDGSTLIPYPLNIIHSTKLNRIDPTAFGRIEQIAFNGGETYMVADSDIQIPSNDDGLYTININGADILLPIASLITFDSSADTIPLPRHVEYIPRNYFGNSTAQNVLIQRQSDLDIITMETNCLPPGSNLIVGGSQSLFYTVADPSYRQDLAIAIKTKKGAGRQSQLYHYDYPQYFPLFDLRNPLFQGLDLAGQSWDLYARSNDLSGQPFFYVNKMNYTTDLSNQVMTVYGGTFYKNYDTAAEILWVPLNGRDGTVLTMPTTLIGTPIYFSASAGDPVSPFTYNLSTYPDVWDMRPDINGFMSNDQNRFGLITPDYEGLSDYLRVKNESLLDDPYVYKIVYEGLRYTLTLFGSVRGPVEEYELDPSRNPIVGRLKLLNVLPGNQSIITVPSFVSDPTKFIDGPLCIPNNVNSFNNFNIQADMIYYYYGMAWKNVQQYNASIFQFFKPNVTVVGLMADTFTFLGNMFQEIAPVVTAIHWMYGYPRTVPAYTFYQCVALGMYPIDISGSVGVSAFEGCVSLPSLSLNVTAPLVLHSNAFKGCTGMTAITVVSTSDISANQTAFEGCTNVQTLTLTMDGVIRLGSTSFTGCTGLATIQLTSDADIYVDQNAFPSCTALTSIQLSSDADIYVDQNAFLGCTALTTINISCIGTLTMDLAAFSGCTNMTTITITAGNNFTYDFSQFKNLQTLSLTIGNSYTELATYSDLSHLQTVTMTSPTVNLQEVQFDGCTALETVTISTIAGQVLADMFLNCPALVTVTLTTAAGASMTSSFSDLLHLDTLYISSPSIALPTSFCNSSTALRLVTLIGVTTTMDSTSFEGCSSLATLSVTYATAPAAVPTFDSALSTLPSLVTVSITGGSGINVTPTNFLTGSDASLNSLTLICTLTGTLPMSPAFPVLQTLYVQTTNNHHIPSYQFANNTALQSVTFIPVTDISEGAFFGCTNMTSLNVFNEGLLRIGDFAFANTGVSGEITIPRTVNEHGIGYFVVCPNLVNIKYLCNVTMFEDPTRITSEVWDDYKSQLPTQTVDISGITTLTLEVDSSLNLSYVDSQSILHAIEPTYQYLDSTAYNNRISAINSTLQYLHPLFESVSTLDISNNLLTLIQSLKVAGYAAYETLGSIPNLAESVGWDANKVQFFTVYSALQDISSAQLEQIPAYVNFVATYNQDPRILSMAQAAAAFAPALSANQNILTNTQNNPEDETVQYVTQLPSNISMALPSDSFVEIQTNSLSMNIDASDPNDVCMVWSGRSQIILLVTTHIDISGTITYHFGRHFPTKTAQTLAWMYHNFTDVNGANSVGISIHNNLVADIRYIDHKQHCIVDISSQLITIHELGMTEFTSSTLYMKGSLLYINDNAFLSWADSSLNIVVPDIENAAIYSGIELFDGSTNVSVTSNKFLTNIKKVIYSDLIKYCNVTHIPTLITLLTITDIRPLIINIVNTITTSILYASSYISILSTLFNVADSQTILNSINSTTKPDDLISLFMKGAIYYNGTFLNALENISSNITSAHIRTLPLYSELYGQPGYDVSAGYTDIFGLIAQLRDASSEGERVALILRQGQGIDPAYTSDVNLTTYVPPNSVSLSEGYPMITFRSTETLSQYALISYPDDWFWCYRIVPDNTTPAVPLLPAPPVSYSTDSFITDYPAKFRYIMEGDDIQQQTGLKSVWSPSIFTIGGAAFSRTYDYMSLNNPDDTSALVYAVKTKNTDAAHDVYVAIGAGQLILAVFQLLLAIAALVISAPSGGTLAPLAAFAIAIVVAVIETVLVAALSFAIGLEKFEWGNMTSYFIQIAIDVFLILFMHSTAAGKLTKATKITKGMVKTEVKTLKKGAGFRRPVKANPAPSPPEGGPGPRIKPKGGDIPEMNIKDGLRASRHASQRIKFDPVRPRKPGRNTPPTATRTPAPAADLKPRNVKLVEEDMAVARPSPGKVESIIVKLTDVVSDIPPKPKLTGNTSSTPLKQKIMLRTSRDNYNIAGTIVGRPKGPEWQVVSRVVPSISGRAIRPYVDTTSTIDIRGLAELFGYDYAIWSCDYSSAAIADKISLLSLEDQDILINRRLYPLHMLSAYTVLSSSDAYSAFGLSGKSIDIYTPLLEANFMAALVGTPPYVYAMPGPDYTPSIPPPPESPPFAAPPNWKPAPPPTLPDGQYYAYPWMLAYYVNNGTNYRGSNVNNYDDYINRAEAGYANKVMIQASPLHTVKSTLNNQSNYMWKGTYIGEPYPPQYADVNVTFLGTQSDYEERGVGLCVQAGNEGAGGDQQSEVFMGTRKVTYTPDYSKMYNSVYNGAQNLNIIIPSGVTTIPPNAFCSSNGTDDSESFTIDTVVIGNSVTEISTNAFFGSGVKSLYYPSGLTIGEGAFTGTGLQHAVVYDQTVSQLTNVQDIYVNVNESTEIHMSPGIVSFKNFTSAKIDTLDISNNNRLIIYLSQSAIQYETLTVDISGASSLELSTRYTVLNPEKIKVGYFVNPIKPGQYRREFYRYEQEGTTLLMTGVGGSFVQSISEPPNTIISPTQHNIYLVTINNNTVFHISTPDKVLYSTTILPIKPNISSSGIASTIGERAFEGVNSMTSFIIPSNCESIGSSAFARTTALNTLSIPDSVISIGDQAFAGSGLTSIRLSSTLSTIGVNVFQDLSSLQVIVASMPPAIVQIASQLPVCSIIYVPTQAVKEQIIRTVQDASLSSSSGPVLGLAVLIDVAPEAPIDLSGTAQDGHAVLTWTWNPSASGSDIVSYTIDLSGRLIENVTSPYTIDKLTNRTPYTIRIAATNVSGLQSPFSDPITITPMPTPPTADVFTELQTFGSKFALYAVDLDGQDVNLWYHHSNGEDLVVAADPIICIYSRSGSELKSVSIAPAATIGPIPHVTFAPLAAGYYYILVDCQSSSSIALQSYTGSPIPLTLVKLGNELNQATGHISSLDTALTEFTILGSPVEHGDTITVHNVTSLNPSIVTNDPDATVEIFGGVDLVEGDYSLTVTVTAADGTTNDSYVILVTVAAVQGLANANANAMSDDVNADVNTVVNADVNTVTNQVIIDLLDLHAL